MVSTAPWQGETGVVVVAYPLLVSPCLRRQEASSQPLPPYPYVFQGRKMARSGQNKHSHTKSPARLAGGCDCGAIRYRCTAAPLYAAACQCQDCQKRTGSPSYSAVAVPSDSFRFTSAPPRYFQKTRDDGSVMQYGFCPSCGSQLISSMPDYPELSLISAQSLEEQKWFREAKRLARRGNYSWCGFWPQLSQESTGRQTGLLVSASLQ